MIRLLNILKLSTFLFLIASGCNTSEKKGEDQLKYEAVVLTPQDFKSKLSSTSDAVIIDVRTPEELAQGKIEGAINIDYKDPGFPEKIAALDKDKTYFVYCKVGKRSANAITQMEEAGFKKLYTLQDGLNNWVEQGLEVVKP